MDKQVTKSRRRWRRGFPALAVAATLLSAIPASSAHAKQRLEVPSEAPGIPAYARVEAEPIHTDEWAAIPFYRDPSCVPADFNLLQFFDVPRSFSCPLTVEGFEVWENGPGIDRAPLHVLTSGNAVPIWFVSWSELEAAVADGVLTITELAALPSLVVGTADRYHEVLHPSKMINITASGTLNDGRSFDLRVTCVCANPSAGAHRVVRIDIG